MVEKKNLCWTSAFEDAALKEGWSLFTVGKGLYTIQRVDCPLKFSGSDDVGEPIFPDDWSALQHIKAKAAEHGPESMYAIALRLDDYLESDHSR